MKEFETMDKICETIEAAQEHILKLSCMEVAKDVIEVNVYGPSCTDLTLIGMRNCLIIYILKHTELLWISCNNTHP
jgi:hypothetical protein